MTTNQDEPGHPRRRESPKERMRSLRRKRREDGFTEVTVWVPADLRPWFRRMAAGLCTAWVGEDAEVTGSTEARTSKKGQSR